LNARTRDELEQISICFCSCPTLLLKEKCEVCVLRGPVSVVGIATCYRLDGPGIESRWEARFSAPVQTSPGAHPVSCTIGTVSFPGVKSGRGVMLTPHPLPVPWSRKSRTIPLLPLCTVRPVQSLSACTRLHFIYLEFWVCRIL
jgi:hypothetical protein